jgi:hypothetical protein
VLGPGDILLNAADHDDEVDISKIDASRFGSDVKVRSSLEIGEVIRHVARLGATYPEIVAILDAAEKQKNLPGPLYVDSVPQANMQYLNKALLGQDEAPKVDDEVKPASGSFLRRMFIRGRGDDDDRSPAKTAPKFPGARSEDEAKPAEAGAEDAKAAAGDGPVAKKDEALQKTGGASASADEESSRPGGRPRILDVFRRRGQ